MTHGGYSTSIRVHQRWVFQIPDSIESSLLPVYSPLFGAGPGQEESGLEHFAVLFSKALGAETRAPCHQHLREGPSEADDT